MGRLGFVAELEPNELPMLERLFSGDYNVEKRQMLKVTLKSKSGSKSFFALNDAVISRGSMTKIIDLDVWLKKAISAIIVQMVLLYQHQQAQVLTHFQQEVL